MIRASIPEIPPSYNKYLGNSHNFRKYAITKEEWEWKVFAAVQDQAPLKPYEKAKLNVTCFFPNLRRRDLDNISVKFICDALVAAGVIKDDNFKILKSITIEGELDRENPRTEIEIQEIN